MAKFLLIDWEDGSCDIQLRTDVIISEPEDLAFKQFGQKLYKGNIVSAHGSSTLSSVPDEPQGEPSTTKSKAVKTKSGVENRPVADKKSENSTKTIRKRKRKAEEVDDVEKNTRNAALEKLSQTMQFKRLGDDMCRWTTNVPASTNTLDTLSSSPTAHIPIHPTSTSTHRQDSQKVLISHSPTASTAITTCTPITQTTKTTCTPTAINTCTPTAQTTQSTCTPKTPTAIPTCTPIAQTTETTSVQMAKNTFTPLSQTFETTIMSSSLEPNITPSTFNTSQSCITPSSSEIHPIIQRPQPILPTSQDHTSAFNPIPYQQNYLHASTPSTFSYMDTSDTYYNNSFVGQLCSTPHTEYHQPLQIQINQLNQQVADLQKRVWFLENRNPALTATKSEVDGHSSMSRATCSQPAPATESGSLQSIGYTTEQLKQTFKKKDSYGIATKKLARRLFTEEEINTCTVSGINNRARLDPARLDVIYKSCDYMEADMETRHDSSIVTKEEFNQLVDDVRSLRKRVRKLESEVKRRPQQNLEEDALFAMIEHCDSEYEAVEKLLLHMFDKEILVNSSVSGKKANSKVETPEKPLDFQKIMDIKAVLKKFPHLKRPDLTSRIHSVQKKLRRQMQK